MLEKVGVKAALKNPEVIDTIYNIMTKHGMKVDKAIFSIVMFGIANSDKIDIGAMLNLGSGLLGNTQQSAQQTAQQTPVNNAANALGALGALAGAMGAGAMGGAQQPSAQPSNAANAANAVNALGALGALGAIAGAMSGAQQGAQQSATQNAQPQQPNVGDAINAIAGIANALNANKK